MSAPDGVDTAQLNDGAVETAKIENLNVTEAKLADSAVTTNKINNTAVTEAKLNTSVAGDGITGGGGSPLAVGERAQGGIDVQTDSIGVVVKGTGALEVESGTPGEMDVKDLGIDTARLADTAVTPAKADLTGTWDFSSGTLKATTPSVDADVAPKSYVDQVAQGLAVKDSCRLATAAALPAYTAAGSGVGKTITINATGDLNVDTVKVLLGDRVLVKDEGAGTHVDNGIYECTTEGAVGVQAVLTRATDLDGSPAGEVKGGCFTFVQEGTTNANSGWILTTNDPITVDTTALTFVQFSGAGQITAGAGLTKTGNTLDVGQNATGAVKVNSDDIEVITDDVTIEDDGGAAPGKLRVKNAGVNESKLNSSVAGNGITGGGGSPLTVVPDSTSISSPSVVVDVNGVRAAVPYIGDKNRAPSDTSGDAQTTGLTITVTPSGDSYVSVLVNGIQAWLAADDTERTTASCYFSGDAGATAKTISAITAGDTLYWNGVQAGFNLKNTKDTLDFNYSYVS